MDNAFVAIVPTRPCPLFGRPVHPWGSPHRLRPGTSPQALQIPPCGGHPALPGSHCRGQRGITPAFGYGALHPSTKGTITLLNTALLPHTTKVLPVTLQHHLGEVHGLQVSQRCNNQPVIQRNSKTRRRQSTPQPAETFVQVIAVELTQILRTDLHW